MNRRAWLPTLAETTEVVRTYYKVVPHDFLCVRAGVVAAAVAHRLGIPASSRLSKLVNESLARLGAVPCIFDGHRVWKRLMPQHFTLEEAVKLSAAIRKIKRDPPAELVA